MISSKSLFSDNSYIRNYKSFIIIFLFFLFGNFIGLYSVYHVDRETFETVFYGFLNPGSAASFCSAFKIPVITAVLGSTFFGTLLIPLFSAFKGFSVSFISACIFSRFGREDVFSLGDFKLVYFLLFNFVLILFMGTAFNSSVLVFKSFVLKQGVINRISVNLFIKQCILFFIVLIIIFILM